MKRSDYDVIMKYTTVFTQALKFKIVPKIKFWTLETLKMSMSTSSSSIYQKLGERALDLGTPTLVRRSLTKRRDAGNQRARNNGEQGENH